jgi:hypothetical protein
MNMSVENLLPGRYTNIRPKIKAFDSRVVIADILAAKHRKVVNGFPLLRT